MLLNQKLLLGAIERFSTQKVKRKKIPEMKMG
jgi:hypothetical protein